MNPKIIIFMLTGIASVVGQAHYVKIHKHNGDESFVLENSTVSACTILERSFLPNFKGLYMGDYRGIKVDLYPAIRLPEGAEEALTDLRSNHVSQIAEIFAETEQLLEQEVNKHCYSVDEISQFYESPNYNRSPRRASIGTTEIGPEVRKIVDSGDPANRIDVVFMGDGYDSTEREKFFLDIHRFVQEMFEGVTFRSYLPLFNIWAIYVESKESGIGYDGPKNTPFKLYREKGELRAVFTGNPKYARQICKLTGENACDFPSLIANDDYYGGLGGEFVIFTRSQQTGKIVLRHEMGHNFLSAGEEYDNGYAYFGANAAKSLENLKWSHWVNGKIREERAMWRILSYPWVDLHKEPVNYTFVSDGRYNRWQLTVSVTAAEHDDDIEFLMDGKPLAWKSNGITDRDFYNWAGDQGFSRGFHSFVVRAKSQPSKSPKIPTMICSVALHEFGDESEFHVDNEHVSAYPTWNFLRRKSYRPTNAGCLMRNMTQEKFCPVCQEGMWIQFLSRISLIDGVDISDEAGSDGTKLVTVKTLQLGQFRQSDQHRVQGERMEIRWIRDNVEQRHLLNKVQIRAPVGSKWTVKVKFETPEVRNDKYGLLQASQRFEV